MMELKDVGKRFGALQALERINLSIRSGEILGLLGDNGAGKSTLIKILSGFHSPSEGKIYFEGRLTSLPSPRQARALGIETVYQDLGLVETLSIARNFFLGRELKKFGLLDLNEMNRIVGKALLETGVRVRDPNVLVGNLSGGERQAIAIGRAWHFGSRVLILDEPTSALSIQETRKVFSYMEQARKRKMAVVFITHNLAHAQAICDRFFIIHQGKGVGMFAPTLSREVIEGIITDGTDGVLQEAPR